MKSNVYVRSNKSIASISMMRLLFLLPLIVYGFYKDGIFLNQNHFIRLLFILKPLMFIGIGFIIGILVNLFFEKLIYKSDDKFIDILFSSFHIEYGVLIAMLMSINTNVIIFSVVTLIMLILSKIFKNRINTVCVSFLIIYYISLYFGSYDFKSVYESSKVLNLNLLDYLIGRGSGGIGATHIILIIVGLVGLELTSSNKTNISIASICTLSLLFIIYSIIKHVDVSELIFLNNNIFLLAFVATDSVTSCYTKRGMMFFGIFVGIIAFCLYFVDPIMATPAAIVIVSLFNNLIDRKLGHKKSE